MSVSVFFALRKCIEEARKEVGNTSYFTFSKCIVNSRYLRVGFHHKLLISQSNFLELENLL